MSEIERLIKACEALRDDLLVRADIDPDGTRAVNVSDSKWCEFNDAMDSINLTAHASASVPEGWRVEKREGSPETIHIYRDSDGAWCGGGIEGDTGGAGLRYEFLAELIAMTTPRATMACPGCDNEFEELSHPEGLCEGCQNLKAENYQESLAMATTPQPADNWTWPLDENACEALRDFIGDDKFASEVTLSVGWIMDEDDKSKFYGLRCCLSEYPEEGSILLYEMTPPTEGAE